MLNRDFEKQVQEKMGELEFTPSAPVWNNIEQQIRKKKDRRRAIFWLPLLAIGLGAGIWWMAQPGDIFSRASSNNNYTSETVNAVPEEIGTKVPSKDLNTTTPVTESVENNINNTQSNIENSTTSGGTIGHNQQPFSPESVNGEDEQATGNKSRPKSTVGKTVPLVTTLPLSKPSEEKNSVGGKEKAAANVTSFNKNTKPLEDRATPLAPVFDSVKARPAPVKNRMDTTRKYDAVVHAPIKTAPSLTDTASGASTEITAANTNKANVDSAVTAATKPPRKRNTGWELQAFASTGLASMNKGFNFGATSTMDQVWASPAPTTGTSQQSYVPPSPVYSGISFAAGILAQKELNEDLSITTGIEYRYYSTGVDIGLKLAGDTVISFNNRSVGEFYTKSEYEDGIGRYNNAYYFISLPLMLDIKLSHKVPLTLHTGFSVQRLLATDGLLFSSRSQVYYQDDNAVNKTQLFSRLAMFYTFMLGKKTPLMVGPELSYGIRRLQKYDGRDKLFSAGLTARIGLNKKLF
jgi:hypothetical protein